MQNFEYQDIDFSKNSWKLRFKEGIKMLYQRPFYSFVPYLIISYLLLGLMFSYDVRLSIKIIMFSALYIMPLLSFEFSWANDNSKIPFQNFKDVICGSVGVFYSGVTAIFMFYLIIILGISAIIEVVEYIFPFLKSDSSMQTPLPVENKKTDYVLHIISGMILVLTDTIACVIMYSLSFYIYLLAYVSRKYKLSDSNLLELAFDCFHDNFKVLVFFAIFGFIQSLHILFRKEYALISVIYWSVFSSLGIIITYLLAKEASGGGSKVEQKESVLSKLFERNPVAVTQT